MPNVLGSVITSGVHKILHAAPDIEGVWFMNPRIFLNSGAIWEKERSFPKHCVLRE